MPSLRLAVADVAALAAELPPAVLRLVPPAAVVVAVLAVRLLQAVLPLADKVDAAVGRRFRPLPVALLRQLDRAAEVAVLLPARLQQPVDRAHAAAVLPVAVHKLRPRLSPRSWVKASGGLPAATTR